MPPVIDKPPSVRDRDRGRSGTKEPVHPVPITKPQDTPRYPEAEPSARRYPESRQQHGTLPPTATWGNESSRARGPPPAEPQRNFSLPTKYGGIPPRPTNNRDCNNTEVANPRPWGPSQHTASEEDDGGWGHNFSVSRWISNLPVGPPSSAPSQIHDGASSEDQSVAPSQAHSPAPSRPDSAPPQRAPVTVFYSDDEEVPAPQGRRSSASTEGGEGSPSDGGASNEASNEASDEGSSAGMKAASAEKERVTTARVKEPYPEAPAPAPRGRDASRGSGLTSLRLSKPLPDPPKKLPWGVLNNPAKFWKRDPHPTTSPIFASRRLYVR